MGTTNFNDLAVDSLTVGGAAVIAEAEMEMLDGITAGTGAASKALVLDANGDVKLPGILDFSICVPGSHTAGSMVSTGSTWVAHATAGACAFKLLCSSTAASGDYATMRVRGRADAVSTGGVEAINASASANIADYLDLCAGYFAVQPGAINTTAAASVATALHAVCDRTGTSSGRTWVAWVDTHQETKSGAGDYLMRLSHNGTVANDGAITIYNGGRMPYLLNFEDVAGLLSTSDSGTFTKTHKIAVKIAGDATAYYLELGTIA